MRSDTKFFQTPRDWEKLTAHPLAQLCEFGAGIDMDGLVENMKEFGYDVDEPIVLIPEGRLLQILDGRHRHAAAVKAKVMPSFKLFTGKQAIIYVAKKLHRQHLGKGPMALLVAALTNCRAGRPARPANFPKTTPSGVINTQPVEEQEDVEKLFENIPDASKSTGVPARTIVRATTILGKGTEELVQAVRDETITMTDAESILNEAPSVQRKAVKDVKEGKTRTARESIDKRKPQLANGEVFFSWKTIEEPLGKIARAMDQAVRVLGNSLYANACDRLANEFAINLKEWKKEKA